MDLSCNPLLRLADSLNFDHGIQDSTGCGLGLGGDGLAQACIASEFA